MPNLGVALVDDDSIVIADIPGLIEGAHEGVGLGIRFLRHLARTAVLVHLVDLADAADPWEAYTAVNRELACFDEALAQKPQIVVATKLDVTEARQRFDETVRIFATHDVALTGISAVTGDSVPALLRRIAEAVHAARRAAADASGPSSAEADG